MNYVLRFCAGFALGFLGAQAIESMVHFHRVTESAGIMIVAMIFALFLLLLTVLKDMSD